MVKVKGSALASRLRWVQLNHGQAGIETLAAAVSDELGIVIREGALMRQWYDFDRFTELVSAIDKTFGKGDLALVKALGRYSADANLTTIYRLFYKVGTVRWILQRAVRLWNVHYDSGELNVRQEKANVALLNVVNFETPNCLHCKSVLGWAERCVELSGGEKVLATIPKCRNKGEKACTFRLEWR